MGPHHLFSQFFLIIVTISDVMASPCKYECQASEGCTVKYIGPPRSGKISGSCFPASLGGACSGTPRECEDCNTVVQCDKTHTQGQGSTTPVQGYPGTSSGSQVPTGLVLAGGWGDDGRLSSVETFPSRPACSIPPLPQGRDALSLTLLPGDGGRLVACGGQGFQSSCVSWRRGQEAWTHYSTLREKRAYHTAAGVEGGKVMLLGGYYSRLTGEITGAEGTFSLQHGGEGSCALGVKEGREVVVTGGYSDGSSYGFVDRYSSDGSFLGELPGLKNTRYYHGCSVYTSASGTFYLVTGGKSLSGSTLLSSTEMLDPRTGSWQEVSPFPRHLYALACDSPRPGTVVCAGGSEIGGFNVRDEVLLFLALENRWEQIGRLGTKRYYHGLVAGSLDFCEDPE